MELMLEILMAALFDVAALSMVLYLIQNIGNDNMKLRFVSATLGIGFLLGVATNCVAGGSNIVLILLALGFMLSYTAFVFTFRGKVKANG